MQKSGGIAVENACCVLGEKQRPLREGRGCGVAVLSAIYHYCLSSGRARLQLRPSDKGRARILEDWRSSHPVAAGMVECRESSVQILSKHAPQLFSTLPRTPSTAFPCQHQARHHQNAKNSSNSASFWPDPTTSQSRLTNSSVR